MNKRVLLSGLLIVALVLGFSACKTGLLEEEDDSEILFSDGRWEFAFVFDSAEYRVKGTVVDKELPGNIKDSFSRVVDLTLNDESVVPAVGMDKNLLIFLKNFGDRERVVTGEFGFTDKLNRRFELLIDGQHTGTKANGRSTITINDNDDTIEIGTFTARKI
jgi:hypothetical protein